MIREAVEDFFRLKADLTSNRRRFVTIQPNTGAQVWNFFLFLLLFS